MSDAWILPRDKQSVLWSRADAPTYRSDAAPHVERGPVRMPARAVHMRLASQPMLAEHAAHE
jgi:hypothetical protein